MNEGEERGERRMRRRERPWGRRACDERMSLVKIGSGDLNATIFINLLFLLFTYPLKLHLDPIYYKKNISRKITIIL